MISAIKVPKRKVKVLGFDTETTGLIPRRPRNSTQPIDINSYPHILQLCSEMYDMSQQKVVESLNMYIKLPDGVEIPEDATNIHGITRAVCDEKGVDIIDALIAFCDMYQRCETYIGHNIAFDKEMILIEIERNRLAIQERAPQCLYLFNIMYERTRNIDSYCTMDKGRKLCNIESLTKTGRKYVKNPKLIELYSHLFPDNKLPDNLHDAAVDVRLTIECYLKIRHNYEAVKQIP